MKKLLFILAIVLSIPVIAQKPLPAVCPGIHEQLLLLQKSFPEMESFKKEKISGDKLITDWTTDISLCSVSGVLQLMFGNRVEMSFIFDKKFAFTDASLKVLTNKLHDDIKNVFGTTYTEKYDEQESGNEEDDEYFDEFKKYTWLKKETVDNIVQVNSIVLQFSEKESTLSVRFLTYKEK